MSSFQTLQNVSDNFATELRQLSQELDSAKIKGNFEDYISKKMRQISLFSAKLKLLRAKTLTLTSEINEQPKSEHTIRDYNEEAAVKIIEQLTVKSITQSYAVKKLITAQNRTLDPEQIEKKKQIIAALFRYRQQELQLRQLENNLKEKRKEHADLREEWDKELGELRDMRNNRHSEEEINADNPIYLRLTKLVEKLEIMRWLVGKLVCSRGHKDWLSVPQQVCAVLKLARTPNTVTMFEDT